MNTKLVSFAAAAGLLIATSMAGMAEPATTSPGQLMHKKGSVKGYPGASGYAPGQLMHRKGSVRGEPGASGYAPGHRKPPTTTGSGNFR
jgi:hypothetical protein